MYGQLNKIKTVDGQEVEGYPYQVLNPEKLCVMRLPTSDELMRYLAAQRTIITDLGMNRTTGEDKLTPRADKVLFDAIRLDKNGEEMDEAEIAGALARITRHSLVSCVRQEDGYLVSISTPFDDKDDSDDHIPATHLLSIPIVSDQRQYRLFVVRTINLPDNMTEQSFATPQIPVTFIRQSSPQGHWLYTRLRFCRPAASQTHLCLRPDERPCIARPNA